MNELIPEGSDRRLTRVLHEWRIETPVPPGFEHHVWRRIASSDRVGVASLLRRFIDRLDAWISRPAMAVSYVSVLLAAGLAIGSWQAGRETARAHQALGRLYVQSVDPYQAPRH